MGFLCLQAHAISTDPGLATTVNCLSAGAAVGISITIFLLSFSAGVTLALLVTYCCCVRGIGESSSVQPCTPFLLRGTSGHSRNEGESLICSCGTLASLDCCNDSSWLALRRVFNHVIWILATKNIQFYSYIGLGCH